MSFRDLVEGSCGDANPLVHLTSHLMQDKALKEEGIAHPFQNFQNEFARGNSQQLGQFTNGNPSQRYRMDSLLAEMREIEASNITKVAPVQSSAVSQIITTENLFSDVDLHHRHTNEAYDENNAISGSWQRPFNSQPAPYTDMHYFNREQWNIPYYNPYDQNFINMNAHQNQWPMYSPSLLHHPADELRYTANEILNATPEFSDSSFTKFMSDIRDGSITIENNQVVTDETIPTVKQENNEEKDNESFNREFWSTMTDKWQQLSARENHDIWNGEINEFGITSEGYNFSEPNPMMDLKDPIKEGRRQLSIGDWPSAVLCFEAAVKQQPESVEAWQLLGISQAENEHDPQAIAALRQCVKLDANNLPALMGLAISLANENYQYQACTVLKEWLLKNPKYKEVAEKMEDNADSLNNPATMSIVPSRFHQKVYNMYLEAIQATATTDVSNVDPDVQNALGVLLTISSEYDKAIDCFRAAIAANPQDSRLWNRLGATLANSERAEEAVSAYKTALELSPGFIRARYNLAITCIHLKLYRLAAEQLLEALNIQNSARSLYSEKRSQSESIWTTLRLAVSLLERRDLLEAVHQRDLEVLNKEFGVNNQAGNEK